MGKGMEIRSERVTSRSGGVKISMERIRKVLARLKEVVDEASGDNSRS